MKKLFLFTLPFFFFCYFNISGAAWYNLQKISFSTPGAACSSGNAGCSPCPVDGDTTGGTETGYPGDVAVNSTGTLSPYPGYNNYGLNSNQSNSVTPTGTFMYCMQWDGSNPSGLNVTYTGGWTNTAKTISVTAKDQGGSKLKRILLERSDNGGASWASFAGGDWDNLTDANNTVISKNFNQPVVNGKSYSYRITAWDYAGNFSQITNNNQIKFDNVIPNPANDITNNNPQNLLANASYQYALSVGINGGAPIVDVEGSMEDANNPATLTTFANNIGNFTENWDISKVDILSQRLANGGRAYTFRISKICDEAGNCWAGTQDYLHYVYANSLNVPTKTVTSNLNNTSNIADGSEKYVNILLKDNYQNEIVPATGIGRTIRISFDVNNQMYLDQHTRTGPTSVFNTVAGGSTYSSYFSIGSRITDFSNSSSTNGNYNFKFKILTPTANESNSDINALFNINDISYGISNTFSSWNSSSALGTSLESHFKPVYYTSINGDLDNGMISNTTQHSILNTYINGSFTPSATLKLEFGGSDRSKFSFNYSLLNNVSFNCNAASSSLSPMVLTSASISFPFNTSNKNLCTKLMQKPGAVSTSAVNSSSRVYFSTHITHDIEGQTVTYNSDVVGRDSYWAADKQETYQQGVKVGGIISSNDSKSVNIVSSQDLQKVGDNSSKFGILGLNQKSISKTEIIKNAYGFMKNVSAGGGGSVIQNLKGLGGNPGREVKYGSDESIIYITGNGNTINLADSSDMGVTGKRTILIKGANLYIKHNLYYTDSKSILGIIVLGGKIYIDPGLTNLAGTLFTDQSVMSYQDPGIGELNPDTNVNILNNQLYINGNIISENTIGGSMKNPIKCPYNFSGTCTQEEAQKYDLNFLRRYYLTPSIVPYNSGKINGGGTCSSASSCSHPNPGDNLYNARVFGDTGNQYAKYPVIIDYNSDIVTNPPPLFKAMK